jgi:hypothetical protein
MRTDYLVLYTELLILIAVLYFFYWKRLKTGLMELELKNQIFVLVIFITLVCLWWTRYEVHPVPTDKYPAIYILNKISGSLELVIAEEERLLIEPRHLGFSILIIPLILVGIFVFRIIPSAISKFKKSRIS